MPSPLTALLLGASEPEPEAVAVPPTTPVPLRRDQRDFSETLNRLTKPIRPRIVGNATAIIDRFILSAYFSALTTY